MAFMMPVMKNNYDIYKKDPRSRKTSECSNGTTSAGNGTSVAAAMGVSSSSATMAGRRQRMKSESFASSPSHTYRMQMQRCQSQKTFPRNASRSSEGSAALSPTRSFCQTSSNSPPKNSASTNAANNNKSSGSQTDLSKFHLRLVEKLRKSFRKDSTKRS